MTGKTKTIRVLGREMTLFNQKCRDWIHPYPWEGHGNLADSGCGIFSLCHAGFWLTGREQDPEAWADFSVSCGGRGDDGTDRPQLLHGLMASGRNRELNLRYEEDGLRNDDDTLYRFLLEEKGVSLCNLRVGHIVCLVAAREVDGVKQVLAIDSVAESSELRVRDAVCEVIPGTELEYTVRNKQGLEVGEGKSFAAFWVRWDQPKDFNLLWKI